MEGIRTAHVIAVLDDYRDAIAVAIRIRDWQWILPDGQGHYQVWAA